MGPPETESKGHDHQDKTAAYRVGKDLQQPHIGQRLISKIYKELKKLVIKRTNNPIKNGVQPKQRTLNRGI